ncbi:MAG: 50S ribosomal protein L30 [Ferruginibacter sp.]|mgnify:CR=1 FL=1|nr:50S ribosomal protein L30 [Ferruginibacter sp.]
MAKKIKVTQVKSVIDRPERQKRTMVALGLKKLHSSVEVEATPQILGMVEKVNHLIKVEEVKG